MVKSRVRNRWFALFEFTNQRTNSSIIIQILATSMVENELNLPVKTKVAGIQKLIFSVDRARHSE